MRTRRSKLVLTALFIATLAGLDPPLTAPAAATEAKPVIGTLTCRGKGTIGLILGSEEALTCSYKPVDGGPDQGYRGTITKLGLDIGATGETVMVWSILGSTNLKAGELAGSYKGVSTDAAIGIGVGANALVGGSSNAIVLQPLSVEAETGVNLALGVAELTLRAAR